VFGRRIDMFETASTGHGMLGRFIGTAHVLARLLGVDLKSYLACTTLEEQKAWFDEILRRRWISRWSRGSCATAHR
jgi:S-adenosylmethionine-diacylglycerol 3-amino-3-carboxypropyl transferase